MTTEGQLPQKTLNFMGKRKIAAGLSIILIIISIISFAINQLNFGLDFTGGTLIEVSYQHDIKLNSVREKLNAAGYRDAVVQHFGTAKDIIVRVPPSVEKDLSLQVECDTNNNTDCEIKTIGDAILALLEKTSSQPIELKKTDSIGPQVGKELQEKGGLGLLIALFVVLIYVAFRFQFKFAIGAVVALTHDVIITVGLFSLFQWEFDLTVLAALLAVIGYSLNDTIVVSDRIRENFRKIRKSTPAQVINTSLTQTLGRTLVTSFTTLIVLIALFVVGGEVVRGFSIALIIGIVIGTYSSIYVAANVLMAMNINKQDLMLPVKEGVEQDESEFIDNMP